MRRKGTSPYLEAQRTLVRAEPTPGIAHRIADGETPLAAWRVESCMTIHRLAAATGIDPDRLIAVESGRDTLDAAEAETIGRALRVIPDLLA